MVIKGVARRNDRGGLSMQVKERLLEAVASGRFEAGERLPSERELAAHFAVSRVTLRQAISELVFEGVLETFPGKGTYVRQRRAAPRPRTGNIAFIRCLRKSEPSSITSDVFYPAILAGAEAVAVHAGFHCIVQTFNEARDERQRLKHLAEKVDGIICGELRQVEFLKQLQATDRPVVLVSPSVITTEVDVVEADNEGGARLGVEYLAELGHRRIAFIGGNPSSLPSKQRIAGYLQGLEGVGIAPEKARQLSYGWRLEDGYRAMKELLSERRPPTAVFAASDLLALGAYQAAQEAGVRVGSELSILGFDDIQLASQSRPPLSTVRVLRREIGEHAARLLFDWIEGRRGHPVKLVVPTRLKIRESTRAPEECSAEGRAAVSEG